MAFLALTGVIFLGAFIYLFTDSFDDESHEDQ